MVFTIIFLTSGAPALADGIRVSPGEARPGQRIHITVPDCGVGRTRHTATSGAFTHRATLHGKADTGEADPRIKDGLAPGTYRIKANCGPRTVLGQVVVATPEAPPAAGPQTPAAPAGKNAPKTRYLALAAVLTVLTAGAALLVARRRR